MSHSLDIAAVLDRALHRRASLLASDDVTAYRLLSGPFEGVPGVFVDRYDNAAVVIVYEGEAETIDVQEVAETVRQRLNLRAAYVKRFVKDRSGLGGRFDDHLTDARPASGEPLPEAIVIREYAARFEVRLYDGFSTGLFLDQRENRRFLAEGLSGRRVLNTFAYTCGFSVTCALAGATTTSIDISRRYLEWGKRNFTLNGLDPAGHYFTCVDALEFLDFARRKKFSFDLVILDPPSFSAGKGGRSFSAARDYKELFERAARVVAPGGRIFASTNNAALATGAAFDELIEAALGSSWRGRRGRHTEVSGRAYQSSSSSCDSSSS